MYEYTSEYAAPNTAVSTSYFYGLNRTRKGMRGEMESMKNMSGAEYPCISPRGMREPIIKTDSDITEVIEPESTVDEISGFTGISNEQFWYNGVVKSGSTKLLARYQWSIIKFGRLYVINGCDEKESVMYQYNPANDKFSIAGTALDSLIVTSGSDSTGSYLATFRYGFNPVRDYTVTDDDGNVIKNEDFFHKYANDRSAIGSENIFSTIFSVGDEVEISGFPTADTNNGQIWYYNTSSEGVVAQRMKDYSSNNTVDADTYSSVDNIDKYAITSAYVKSFKSMSQSVSGQTTYVHYIYFDLTNKNGETVSFDDMQGVYREYCSGVTISKRRRRFNAVTAHHGRIWGTVVNGSQIYASASDDIFSFSAPDINNGFAARLSINTSGIFTGICEYGNVVIAFKENSYSIIYGSNPANYSVENMNGIGCIDGKSIAVTPAGVIFLSHKGFYMYTGSVVPTLLSDKLKTRYTAAVSGYDGRLYYASALRADGARELIVYDTQRNVWHVHDDFAAVGFFRYNGKFYLADKNTIYEQTDTPGSDEWEFTACKTMDSTLDNKAVNEIWIMAELSEGAYFKVWTSVDDDEFVMHRAYAKKGMHLINCPVRARSGTMYRYRITGSGGVVFYNIEIKKADEAGARNNTEKAVSPVNTSPKPKESVVPY